MILKKLVIGSQLFFVREGTVIAGDGGGTVGQYYKPNVEVAPPYAHWVPMGGVKDFTATPKTEAADVYEPAPGAYQRTDEVVTSRALDLTFNLTNVSPLFFESLMMGVPNEDGDYIIGGGTGKIRGWIKCQHYSQDDTLLNVFDAFVSFSFKATKLENKLLIPELNAKVLYSPLGTGTLSFA